MSNETAITVPRIPTEAMLTAGLNATITCTNPHSFARSVLHCQYHAMLMEHLRSSRQSASPAPSPPTTQPATPVDVTEAELRYLMRDPRYWRERDPEVIARVIDGFRRLHQVAPTAPQPQPDALVEAVRSAYDRLDTIAAEDGRVGAIADLVRAYAALRTARQSGQSEGDRS